MRQLPLNNLQGAKRTTPQSPAVTAPQPQSSQNSLPVVLLVSVDILRVALPLRGKCPLGTRFPPSTPYTGEPRRSARVTVPLTQGSRGGLRERQLQIGRAHV